MPVMPWSLLSGIRTAFQTISSAPTDLVLLDGSVPELSKLLLSQRIRQLAPQIAVVVISEADSEREHFSRDCVLTHGSKTDLLKCIDLVLAGQKSAQVLYGQIDPAVLSF
jgi:DNA-binding NarL/FixJ family response regulator